MVITTTLTWGDLKENHREDLSEYREAYDELREQATDQYGEDALDQPLPSDPNNVDADNRELWAYQQQAERIEQAAESIENRLNMLGRLEEEYGAGTFEIKMLSGSETMDVETDLRMTAQERGMSVENIQHRRNLIVVDKATVDAPEDVPRDDDGSPTPSECPNALALSLWEHINTLNNAGQTDFRPEGFGDNTLTSPTTATSDSPTPSSE